ncbi:mechanosensitive ion channel family protein [uncultured Dechloromonas sp.]|uniref:mechanosensitive ion channel family protein n=1 Tax=uncultured Dechloromonas sp. TaxID=171719 RepID=UPI0025CD810B|nr:mechanosensitive ion channel family protein [uncultured Dechloromonas sp.]
MLRIPFLSPEAPYATIALALLLMVILRPLRAMRPSLINTSVFFLACLIGDLLAGLVSGGSTSRTAAGWLRQLAVFGEGLAVIRFAGLAFFNVALPRVNLRISGILGDILVIVGYVGWAFFRLNLAGVELSHLFATSAILTAVLAISMQDTLGNLLGGVALQMDNSLEIGDWIRIDDLSGQVTDIQWRFTALLTRNGEKVVVPNSQLMKGRYYVLCDKHQSLPGWRRSIGFNVDLAIPPGKIIDLVQTDIADANIPNIALQPAPNCVLMDFGPGYAHYVLRYWLLNPKLDDPTDSDVRVHILATLQRNGVRLATDDHTIHLVEEGAKHRKEVESRELLRRLQAIDGIELFTRLSDTEKRHLAEHLVKAPFARGDIITRQGAIAHWLYIMVSGEAEAWWQPPEGARRLLETRGPGSVFGEIGLMTGAPRRATVVASTNVEAYRLDKAGFQSIIEQRPELADMLSSILERRLQRFAELEQGYTQGQNELVRNTPGSADIGRKIRDFFGLN